MVLGPGSFIRDVVRRVVVVRYNTARTERYCYTFAAVVGSHNSTPNSNCDTKSMSRIKFSVVLYSRLDYSSPIIIRTGIITCMSVRVE